jgi:hypothetical protein
MTKYELMGHITDAINTALTQCRSENPLEAWARFIDKLDSAGRRSIGDTLEQQNRNRYTGQVIR